MYRMAHGKVNVGDMAPDIHAVDINGEHFILKDRRMKNNVVIFFYRSSECSTCLGELKSLKMAYDRLKKQGVEIVAISAEDSLPAKRMSNENKLPFPVISDLSKRSIHDYGVYDKSTDMPFITLFIIDRGGVVRYKKHINGLEDMFNAEDIVEKIQNI
jgi:peroxiredoxin Q/BCP